MVRGLKSRLRHFRKDTRGATMVEMAVVLPLTLLILFALYDFGRMAFAYIMAEKGVQIAARTAAVRPAVCGGVPNSHVVNTALTPPPRFGTYCSSGNACGNPGNFVCVGSGGSPTANEIWGRVATLLPQNATIANLRFTYAFDPNLGFVGGPYTPMVTVETTNLNFNFILPIGPLGSFITGTPNTFGNSVPFPTISVSMPGEDLNLGTAG